MTYYWACLLWWLSQGQNAAVQAITAVVVSVLTVVLIGVTWFYAWKTGQLTKLQLASNFVPNIEVAFRQNTDGTGVSGNIRTDHLLGILTIACSGGEQFKLHSVHFVARSAKNKHQMWEKQYTFANPVIAPGKPPFEVKYAIDVEEGSGKADSYRQVIVVCSNLSETSRHILERTDDGHIRHYLGTPNLRRQLKKIKKLGLIQDPMPFS